MSELAAIVRALYCERGRPSGAKMMAVAATAIVFSHVAGASAPDFHGAAMFLGVPWAIILGRKKVEVDAPV